MKLVICKFIFTLIFISTLLSYSQTTIPFIERYKTSGINGSLIIVGNSLVGETATLPYNGITQNNFIDMVYIDIDGDATTFNSSSANFTTNACNKIVYAGLYWGAIRVTAPQVRETVKFKVPGGNYIDLTADVDLDRVQYKDVTSIVAAATNPSGDYFVANVGTREGFGASAGWTLVLVYEDPSEPRKYISTFDGFSAVGDAPNNIVDFSYSGFVTPPSGPVEGKVGVAALEGDLGWTGDQMLFRSDGNTTFTALFDAESPVDNFFNSKITENGVHITNRNVNSTNTLGWDQKLLNLTALNTGNSLIGNGETGATVRVTNTAGGDWIFTFLNTLEINIIEPVIEVLTSVEDTSGNQVTLGSPIQLGETVWYNINFQNTGTDNAQNTTIVNTLPINVTLDESSLILPTGVIHSFNSATRVLLFTIDNSLVVRESNPNNAAYDIRYQVTASADCFDYSDACTNLLENFIESSYDGETSGTNITGQPGLNGISGCGLGNVGSMDLFVDTSSCQFDTELQYCNNNLTITGDDGYNIYRWVDENNTLLAANSKTITVSGPGVYTCTQTKVGCTVTTRTVTVLGLDVTFTPSNVLCKDSADGSVNITVVDDAATFTYELSKGGTVIATESSTALKSHDFTGLDIGSYSVKITNTDGCFDIFDFTISEPTLLRASSNVLDNIMPCNGNALIGRIEATATGGTTPYEYNIDGGAYQSSNIFEVSTEGNHIINVKDANGCITSTTANIDFDEEIEYNITKEDVVCVGGADGEITVNITQNDASNTITYSKDGTNFQASPVFSGLSKGDYTITIRKVKSVNTCDITQTKSLVELTDLQFEASAGFSCGGSGNQVIATVADQYVGQVSYTLDGTITQSTGIFENVSDGDHTVTVTNTINGCSAPPITVTVEAYIPVTFTVTTVNPNEYTIDASGGEPQYEYAMNDENDMSSDNVFVINKSGLYTFYVKDDKGCIVEKQMELEFLDIVIPDFFTPQGDGVNDTWYPINISIYPNIAVQIFDRYQRQIARYKGNTYSWDGMYDNKPLPSGDYWYIIKLNESSDNREFKGNFTLVR
ncbi:MAG: T9SS type B sorting domain-containing protein [Flavobacteriaceae bacterium]|nr:T9SS type B sorting domain-containing protein [Flavobacteriaceae bacterium]